MSKGYSWIKKSLKTTLWGLIGILLLLIVLAGLIQLPAIQTRIIQTATSYVSNKTHTKVEINKVSIAFPKTVHVDGIYLEDKRQDTLLFISKLEIGISLVDLFYHKISSGHIQVNNLYANLYNTPTDSLFNYNFLISAFSDTTQNTISDSTTSSPWTFDLGELQLNHIRLNYRDEYGGMNVKAGLHHLDLKMDKLDLADALYSIDGLHIDGLIAQIKLSESNPSTTDKTESSKDLMPIINAHFLQISSSSLSYENTITNEVLKADINDLSLKSALLNMQESAVKLDNLDLSESQVSFYAPNPDSISKQKPVPDTIPLQNDWKVKINSIRFENNNLTLKQGNILPNSKSFNANNLELNHLTFVGENITYAANKTELSITEFSVRDQNDFSITHFSTGFSMDQQSISIRNLGIKTTHSAITGDIGLKFTSLQSLQDSIGYLVADIHLKEAKLGNSDLLYFIPTLSGQPYFQEKSNTTTLSGKIRGPINHLAGEKLELKAGNQTLLTTDFTIKGLPEVKTAYFHFPNLRLVSGKTDLLMIAGTILPEAFDLPEFIDLNITFRGELNDFETTLLLESSFGSADITANLDANENFSGKAKLNQFNLGNLLKDTAMFGPISLSFETKGHGLDIHTLRAQIKGEASSIYFNRYTYQNLMISGQANKEQFEGEISLNDKNIAINIDGLVNVTPENERFKVNLNLKGADLKKLQLTPADIQIGLMASVDLTGTSIQTINGNALITQLIVMDNGEQYNLDSILITTNNSPANSQLNIQSPLLGLQYNGTNSPIELPAILSEWALQYFPTSDSAPPSPSSHQPSRFNFEIKLQDHLITQVLFPKLTKFEPGIIQGSFDSDSMSLKLNTTINYFTYDNTEVNNFKIHVQSNKQSIEYIISSDEITNPRLNLNNFTVEGKIVDDKILTTLSSTSTENEKNLYVSTQLEKTDDNFRLSFDQQQFYLMNERWDISTDNYLLFGSEGFLIHNLNISKSNSLISIHSVNNTFSDDLNIAIKNFKLYNIFGIFETDSNLIRGTVNGNILLKRVHHSYGILADAQVDNLTITQVPIGNITLKAKTNNNTKFDIKFNLNGAENEMSIAGYYIPDGGAKSLNLRVEIPSLSMKTAQAFSLGQIQEASGYISGEFKIDGPTNHPIVSGELTFNKTFIKPKAVNNQFELISETVQVKNDGIHFDQFTLLDKNQRQATIDGTVKITKFNDFILALQVNTNDFLLINTTAKDNKNFYGKLIIDSKINIHGPMSSPIVNARIKMKNGSNITIAVPESQLTTNTGQGIVEFTNHSRLNPILDQIKSNQTLYTGVSGFGLSSVIEIDKLVKLRILMDPTSNDSLVVQGEAALSFTMDKSGKMSLTGAYQLTDGSYVVSLESFIKKKFIIEKGSTITWNGDALDAGIAINALYSVRASPNNLIGEQTSGMTDTDKNASMQRYPFLVLLKIRGEILQPEISFEIQLPQEEKGLLGGAVEAKLMQLNEDPSELNKQVFALLMLGRFVQENPLEFGVADGTTNMIRATVSSFLSAELNKWSSKLVPGVELNFDVNSYNEYESNQTMGRTQVDIGLKKQLFDERLTVQIGGVVDVEGAKAKENSVSNITSDVSVEYELTKDGRYRLIGFSHNQYEGAIEGQVVETGIGIIYQRDFNEWKDFFKSITRQK